MEPSQTEVESIIIELAENSFKTFCDDISGMFGIDMECSQQEVTSETVNGLQTLFKDLVVAYSVKAEGAFDGAFQFVFDQNGLFILAGVVAMHPEQLILENAKFPSLEKAEKVSDILKEIGAALAGAWDRVLRKGLDGHRGLVQTNTFIGNPWDKSEEKIGLSADEELLFVPYEMTVGSYPAFKCGTIFPKAIFAGTPESGTEQPAPAEEKPQEETEDKAPNVSEGVQETEEKTQEETENTAPNVSEAVQETEEKSQGETEERDANVSEAVQEIQEKTQEETKVEAEDQKTSVDKVDSGESDTAQKSDSESSEPQEPVDGMVAVEQAKAEEDSEQAIQAEEGAATAEQPQPEAEETVVAGESATKQEPEETVEQKPDDVEEVITTTTEIDTRQEHPISEAIQKMTRSSAELPAESTPSTTEEKPALSSKETPLDLCAKDIMQKDVLWGNPDDSVQKALAKIQQHDAGYMLIGKEQVPEGIVSKSDLSGALSPYLRTIFAKWRRPLDDATLQIKIKWIMSKPTHNIGPETSLVKIMENMCQSEIRCLPVVDEQGKVRGLVTVFDIFKVLLKHSYIK